MEFYLKDNNILGKAVLLGLFICVKLEPKNPHRAWAVNRVGRKETVIA